MRKYIAFLSVVLLSLVLAAPGWGQDKSKRPSPPANAEMKCPDGATVTVNYSSPRAKGRKVFGGLVPYGQVWRLGANEATTFVTDSNLMVGDKEVPAGSYTIFAIPNEGKWTLVISKKTGEWGIPYPGEADDLVRTDMHVENLPAPVEDFTISFHVADNKCSMRVEWETTRAWVNISKK